MSQYIETARTNYFEVRNQEALVADLARYGVAAGEDPQWSDGVTIAKRDDNSIALIFGDGLPNFDLDEIEEAHEDEGLPFDMKDFPHEDVISLVGSHLADGSVAVFTSVGQEKTRYVNGVAVAINAKGETRTITLDDIYEKARELTPNGERVSIAAY